MNCFVLFCFVLFCFLLKDGDFLFGPTTNHPVGLTTRLIHIYHTHMPYIRPGSLINDKNEPFRQALYILLLLLKTYFSRVTTSVIKTAINVGPAYN